MFVYCSQQSVLREAGLWQRELAETPSGAANGSNKIFTVDHKPLTDNNYDDAVDASDVVVYVNGVPVQVVTLDVTTGSLTLVSAPANDADVTVDYSYSPLPLDLVAQIIEEVQDIIDAELEQVVTTPYTEGTLPKRIRLITRFFAAGVLMSGEYVLQSADGSAKEGQAKIKQAEAWLTAYRARLESNGSDVGEIAVPRASDDRRIFQRYNSADGTWNPLRDENFDLNEAD